MNIDEVMMQKEVKEEKISLLLMILKWVCIWATILGWIVAIAYVIIIPMDIAVSIIYLVNIKRTNGKKGGMIALLVFAILVLFFSGIEGI
ncbi:MAG: hypothetical protein RSG57_04435 [Christensenellaceae bacterium]